MDSAKFAALCPRLLPHPWAGITQQAWGHLFILARLGERYHIEHGQAAAAEGRALPAVAITRRRERPPPLSGNEG